jgi:hypothetical protein
MEEYLQQACARDSHVYVALIMAIVDILGHVYPLHVLPKCSLPLASA